MYSIDDHTIVYKLIKFDCIHFNLNLILLFVILLLLFGEDDFDNALSVRSVRKYG